MYYNGEVILGCLEPPLQGWLPIELHLQPDDHENHPDTKVAQANILCLPLSTVACCASLNAAQRVGVSGFLEAVRAGGKSVEI